MNGWMNEWMDGQMDGWTDVFDKTSSSLSLLPCLYLKFGGMPQNLKVFGRYGIRIYPQFAAGCGIIQYRTAVYRIRAVS